MELARWEPTAIATLRSLVEQYSDEYEHFGLRCLSVYRDAVPAPAVGDVLSPSSVWVDGEPTDEELSGTSALWIGDEAESDGRWIRTVTDDEGMRKARALASYYGQYVVLIAGNYASSGVDLDETIIRDATVLAVFDRGTIDCDHEVWR